MPTRSTRPTPRGPGASGPRGLLAGAVIGSLSCLLLVAAWAVLAVVLGGTEATLRPLPVIATGALFGLLLASLDQRRRTAPLAVLALGLAAAAAWLALSGGRPLAGPGTHRLWQLAGALLTFPAASYLTGYGLRDLDLAAFGRSQLELLFIRILRAAGFTFFLSVVIFPFYFMVAASLKSRAQMLERPTFLGLDLHQPLGSLLQGYVQVLTTFHFARFILNSSFVAIVTVVITLTLAVLGAYAVTRLRFQGRRLLSRSILLIYMFPAIVLVVPLYTVFTQIGLRDTLPGLLIVYPATTLPVALYMLRSYFQTLPADLEEAGLIDGCTRASVIWRITLPLSLPALASVALYVFMIAWNEFLFAFMFLDTPAIFTLSRGMVALNSQEVPRQYLMAGAVIVTVPIMLLFLWFERYLVSGLTAGSVKG